MTALMAREIPAQPKPLPLVSSRDRADLASDGGRDSTRVLAVLFAEGRAHNGRSRTAILRPGARLQAQAGTRVEQPRPRFTTKSHVPAGAVHAAVVEPTDPTPGSTNWPTRSAPRSTTSPVLLAGFMHGAAVPANATRSDTFSGPAAANSSVASAPAPDPTPVTDPRRAKVARHGTSLDLSSRVWRHWSRMHGSARHFRENWAYLRSDSA